MKISTLLKKKGKDVVSVPTTATMSTVISRLRLEKVGCLVISDDRKHIDGIIAVRDIVYAMSRDETKLREMYGFDILDTPVKEVMTSAVKTCSPDDNLRDVMATMTQYHILHVPVVEKGELAGIVSIDDVVRYAVEEMDLEAKVLHDTVVGLRTINE